MSGEPDSTQLLSALRQASIALTDRGVPFALIGGLAVSIRVEPRFTRDIDLAVAVSGDEQAEALVRDLTTGGFLLRQSLEQRALGRLAAVRMAFRGEPTEGTVVDLLFASSGIEAEVCRVAERIEVVPGLVVPVAQSGHLVAMKLLALASDRPQDSVDLHALVGALTDDGRKLARDAVVRIEELGTNRGKPLRAQLEKWLAQ